MEMHSVYCAFQTAAFLSPNNPSATLPFTTLLVNSCSVRPLNRFALLGGLLNCRTSLCGVATVVIVGSLSGEQETGGELGNCDS